MHGIHLTVTSVRYTRSKSVNDVRELNQEGLYHSLTFTFQRCNVFFFHIPDSNESDSATSASDDDSDYNSFTLQEASEEMVRPEYWSKKVRDIVKIFRKSPP